MSGNGSDFENDGDFMQEPSAKKSKLEEVIEEHGEVLQLHTDWDHRDTAPRHDTYTTDSEGPVPVPQSDFEIEINSSNQDCPTSPGHEITLASTSITTQLEPRILTIDSGHITTVHTSIGPQTLMPSSPEEVTPDQSPSNGTSGHDFTSLIAAAGRSGLLPTPDQLSTSDLANNQFILQSRSSTDGSQPGAPLYVMIPPSNNGADLLQAAMQSNHTQSTQRPLLPNSDQSPLPRLASGAIIEPSDDVRKHKEYIRKQTHNEVERRRRDRINELIKMLAEIVPGCQKKDATNGNIVGYVYSKGTVLEKTVEYVRELLTQNDQLSATAKLAEKSAGALQVLQNQITVLEKENAFLRAQMIQLGLDSSTSALNARSLLSNPLAQSLLNPVQVPTPLPPPPNTTQLLMNLAQTLTTNPLLAATLGQQPVQQPASDPQPAPAIPSVANSHHGNVSNHVMNSLVQTLANITGSSPTAPPPPPAPPTHTSTAIAMNLLNSLIMAQSALTSSTSTTSSTTPPDPATTMNMLLSSHPSPEKAS